MFIDQVINTPNFYNDGALKMPLVTYSVKKKKSKWD